MRGTRRRIGDDAGGGAALALALVSASITAAAVALGASGLVVASARVAAAADASALAAADTAAGWAAGDPCDRAALVASANGARLASCSLDGLTASVTVVDAKGLPIGSAAVAGPPE